MRFLHTADWHVGKTIRGRSRVEEFEAVLTEIVAIAKAEQVDAVLLAGDIYDQRAVTADADRLLFDTLLNLHAASIPVIAIPGNHDSALRLEVFGRLLERIGTSIVPRVMKPDAGGMVEVPSRDGSSAANIACVPFVPERRFGDAADLFADPATLTSGYDDKMGVVMSTMASAFAPDRVNILMGHLFIDGARVGGGEREITIGRNYAVSPAHIPANTSYVALGHIHRPQQMKGCPSPTYYSGSLLQLDFGERDQEKLVYIVDAAPKKPAQVTAIKLSSGRKLIDVPAATLDELESKAGDYGDAYLRVAVKTEGPVPGLADRVREILPNALEVHLSYLRGDETPDVISLRTLEPREQFLSYFEHTHGVSPSDDLMDAFDNVYEEATS
jgi:exonuclease SbcD